MIATDERLDRALRAADPRAGAATALPSVEDDVLAALAWDDRHPAAPTPADHHRRVLGVGVAVVGLAAAAVLIIPLMTPVNSPLGAPYAAAADLQQVAANARATADMAATTITYHDHGMNVASTPTGAAYYWQDADVTDSVTSTEITWTFAFEAPQYLTPADEQRAETMPAADRPAATTTTQHLPGADITWPSPEWIAALPTSATALAAALPTDGCDNPSCRFARLQTIIDFPGTTGAQRAAALDLMAVTPGVTILGPRIVNGHRGLAVHNADAPMGGGAEATYVIDATDGTQLAEYDTATAASLASIPFPVAPGALIGQRERTN
jgi:hypothetical protein